MEALGAWLKQIIVVVLLATFIDLLLPNRTMQRYVKLVVSLFILVTILSPVMQLLGANINFRIMAATTEGWMNSWAASSPYGTNRAVPAVSEVLANGESLMRERNDQTLSLVAEKLAEMVSEHVTNEFGLQSISSEASVEFDRDGFPAIREIRIRIGQDRDGQNREDEPVKQWGMRPVKPVTVAPVQIGHEQKLPPPPEEQRIVEPALMNQIAASVAKVWNVHISKVTVVHEGG